MARTKGESSGRSTGIKVIGGKAQKRPSSGSSSAPKLKTYSRKSKGVSWKSIPCTKRSVPSWQKPITNFTFKINPSDGQQSGSNGVEGTDPTRSLDEEPGPNTSQAEGNGFCYDEAIPGPSKRFIEDQSEDSSESDDELPSPNSDSETDDELPGPSSRVHSKSVAPKGSKSVAPKGSKSVAPKGRPDDKMTQNGKDKPEPNKSLTKDQSGSEIGENLDLQEPSSKIVSKSLIEQDMSDMDISQNESKEYEVTA